MSELNNATDADTALEMLTEGDVIRMEEYENMLEVTHVEEIESPVTGDERHVYVDFVDNPTDAIKVIKPQLCTDGSSEIHLKTGDFGESQGVVDEIEIVAELPVAC